MEIYSDSHGRWEEEEERLRGVRAFVRARYRQDRPRSWVALGPADEQEQQLGLKPEEDPDWREDLYREHLRKCLRHSLFACVQM